MPRKSAIQPGEPVPTLGSLEARYGSLRPLDRGMQSRVYLTQDGARVVKVYRDQRGEHRLEAENMAQAGLGDQVLDLYEADGIEALVMVRFPGQPLRPEDVLGALPALSHFLKQLHHPRPDRRVELPKLRERLKRFRSSLAAYPLSTLFEAVERPLEAGLLDQPAVFCHLDLWHDNILIAQDGRIQVIDWTKAGFDDPLRDLALLKTGTLDLLPAAQSLEAALGLLPDRATSTLIRLRAYLALTTLHDLYWFLMNEPYHFEEQRSQKLRRAQHVLGALPELD